MLISLSATKEQAVEDYAWFTFTGSRGKELSQRTHKRKITKGTVFGIKSLRSGARFTLIFPDLIHINFPLDKAAGEYLIERSDKMKKVLDIGDRNGRKTAGVKTSRRQEMRRDFSSLRFTPKGVLLENKAGINFENYQWRIVPQQMQLLHSKGREVFQKGDLIGLRFVRPSRGGFVVNREGLWLKVDADAYDELVTDTDLLPIQDWPNGFVDPDAMLEYKTDRKRAARNAIQNTAEAMRLQRKADALEQELARSRDKAERKEAEKAAQKKYDDIRAKIKAGEITRPERDILPTLPEHISKDRTTMRERTLAEITKDQDELLEELEDFNSVNPDLVYTSDLDSTESPAEQDLENILAIRPVSAPVFDIEDTLTRIFNPSEDDEESEDPFDLEGLSDDEEDNTDSDADSDDGSDEEDSEDDGEGDDSEEDSDDPAEDDDGDGDIDDEDDSEDVSDGDDDADGTENEEDSEPNSGSGDDDAGAGDSGDDDSGSDEDGSGSLAKGEKVDGMTDEEAAKVAKRYAANNANGPTNSKQPEEGDVLVFNNDKKMKREFVILNVSTHKKSAKLITYRLYDLTNAPDTINTVTINKDRGQSILDQATHIKDMRPGVFNRVYDMTENYSVSKDPIMS